MNVVELIEHNRQYAERTLATALDQIAALPAHWDPVKPQMVRHVRTLIRDALSRFESEVVRLLGVDRSEDDTLH